MPTAYVLLNTEIGAKKQVLKALQTLECVEEIYNLLGVYDIIVNVSAKSLEEIKHIITQDIDGIGQINSKLTLIISDKAPVIFPVQNAQEGHIVNSKEPIPIFA
jgi:DNA-binding Lrp family transcriptional regulator